MCTTAIVSCESSGGDGLHATTGWRSLQATARLMPTAAATGEATHSAARATAAYGAARRVVRRAATAPSAAGKTSMRPTGGRYRTLRETAGSAPPPPDKSAEAA